MKLLISNIRYRQIIIPLLSVTFAVLHTMAYQPLVSFTFSTFLLKSLADGLILLGIGVLLSLIIPLTNYVKLEPLQQFINYFALGVLVISLWVVLSYAASYLIFGNENAEELVDIIPMSAFIGILLYLLIIQFIQSHIVNTESVNKSKEENSCEQKEVIVTNDDQIESDVTENIERIAVKIGQKIHVILVPDIIYIESDGDYVRIITDKGKFVKEDTMKYYESGLPKSQFVRVHRSYIVNVEKIHRIELYEKQNQMLILKNGDQIRASVSGYKSLRVALNL